MSKTFVRPSKRPPVPEPIRSSVLKAPFDGPNCIGTPLMSFGDFAVQHHDFFSSGFYDYTYDFVPDPTNAEQEIEGWRSNYVGLVPGQPTSELQDLLDAIAAVDNAKINKTAFGFPALLYLAGKEVQGFANVQAAHDAIPTNGSGVIVMNSSYAGNVEVTKTCTIYGGSYSLGRLQATFSGKCTYYGNIVSNQPGALYSYLGGQIDMLGNITHNPAAGGPAYATITVLVTGTSLAGRINLRGDITNSCPSGEMSGIIVAGGTARVDYNGTIRMLRAGRIADLAGICTIRGALYSNDLGVQLRTGTIDLFCHINTENSTSATPEAVTITQSAAGPSAHYFHAGSEILSPAGKESFVNGNPGFGLGTIQVAPGVVCSMLPDPAQINILHRGLVLA